MGYAPAMAGRIAAIALLTVACATSGSVLRYEDVRFFDVEVTRPGPRVALTISGMMANAGLGVESVSTEVNGTELAVLVVLGVGGHGLPGEFKRFIDVPDGVNTIVFGIEKNVIWTRPKP
jgi:hypothetical protein